MIKRFSLLFIILFLLIGCSKEEDKIDISESIFKSLKDKFTIIKNISKMEYGYAVEQYSLQNGILYSTYYNALLLSELNYDFESIQRDKIEQYLVDFVSINEERLSVYDLYYVTKIIEILKLDNSYLINEILTELEKSKNKAGYFEDIHDKDADYENYILPTYYAIYINDFSKKNSNVDRDIIESNSHNFLLNQINNNEEITIQELLYAIDGLRKLNSHEIINESIVKKLTEFLSTPYLENEINLFDFNTRVLAYDIIKNINKNVSIDKDFIYRSILSFQNFDGGWNAFFDNFSEEHGSYLAVSILNKLGKKIPNDQILIKNTLKKIGLNGLFVPNYKKEFSFSNTYFVYKLNGFFELETDLSKNDINWVYENIVTKKNLSINSPIEIYYTLDLFDVDVNHFNKEIYELTEESIKNTEFNPHIVYRDYYLIKLLTKMGSRESINYSNVIVDKYINIPNSYDTDIETLSMLMIFLILMEKDRINEEVIIKYINRKDFIDEINKYEKYGLLLTLDVFSKLNYEFRINKTIIEKVNDIYKEQLEFYSKEEVPIYLEELFLLINFMGSNK
ncbi:hypothetical protein [Sutcliffiella sp. NC1]|uniref:hypothetical protein n=1 Tax=Sutcliffiella sp. NC1 TaxID=3004096 RepID=UPI0022DDF1E2|nr:hypothetical protein [Sutcliffiella sp. NC1]WBL16466.1 hypothetical protein O1A01_07495 [Sutcliffiella sp. NC1]